MRDLEQRSRGGHPTGAAILYTRTPQSGFLRHIWAINPKSGDDSAVLTGQGDLHAPGTAGRLNGPNISLAEDPRTCPNDAPPTRILG
jgi:hypothetical protein